MLYFPAVSMKLWSILYKSSFICTRNTVSSTQLISFNSLFPIWTPCFTSEFISLVITYLTRVKRSGLREASSLIPLLIGISLDILLSVLISGDFQYKFNRQYVWCQTVLTGGMLQKFDETLRQANHSWNLREACHSKLDYLWQVLIGWPKSWNYSLTDFSH